MQQGEVTAREELIRRFSARGSNDGHGAGFRREPTHSGPATRAGDDAQGPRSARRLRAPARRGPAELLPRRILNRVRSLAKQDAPARGEGRSRQRHRRRALSPRRGARAATPSHRYERAPRPVATGRRRGLQLKIELGLPYRDGTRSRQLNGHRGSMRGLARALPSRRRDAARCLSAIPCGVWLAAGPRRRPIAWDAEEGRPPPRKRNARRCGSSGCGGDGHLPPLRPSDDAGDHLLDSITLAKSVTGGAVAAGGTAFLSDEVASLSTGSRWGQLEILERVDASFADVHLARDVRLDREVALEDAVQSPPIRWSRGRRCGRRGSWRGSAIRMWSRCMGPTGSGIGWGSGWSSCAGNSRPDPQSAWRSRRRRSRAHRHRHLPRALGGARCGHRASGRQADERDARCGRSHRADGLRARPRG